MRFAQAQRPTTLRILAWSAEELDEEAAWDDPEELGADAAWEGPDEPEGAEEWTESEWTTGFRGASE